MQACKGIAAIDLACGCLKLTPLVIMVNANQRQNGGQSSIIRVFMHKGSSHTGLRRCGTPEFLPTNRKRSPAEKDRDYWFLDPNLTLSTVGMGPPALVMMAAVARIAPGGPS